MHWTLSAVSVSKGDTVFWLHGSYQLIVYDVTELVLKKSDDGCMIIVRTMVVGCV